MINTLFVKIFIIDDHFFLCKIYENILHKKNDLSLETNIYNLKN